MSLPASTLLEIMRGDSKEIGGTLAPAAGRTFSTPISALKFTVKRTVEDASPLFQKTVGSGVSISAQSSTAISYVVTINPADTASLTEQTTLVWDLELTEANGWKSTMLRGLLRVELDVTT